MHGLLGMIPAAILMMIMAVSSCSQHEAPAAPPDYSGDLVWRNGSMVLRLTELPCGFQNLADDLNEAAVPPAKALVIIQEGRPQVPGCWAVDMEGDVQLRDVGGGEGFVPLSWFTPAPQV